MKKISSLITLYILLLGLNILDAAHPDQSGRKKDLLNDWKKNVLIGSTEKKPARTAILIIAPPVMGNCPVFNRWKLGKKVWEQYMNNHPNVDCYFLQCTNSRPGQEEQVWLEGNTIYVVDSWYDKYGIDRILHKTIAAIEWLLPHYTHFIRTNLNTFINLKNANMYMETHHQSFYTAFLWQTAWYALGYGIAFTADVAAHITKEYRRLEAAGIDFIDPSHPDDCVLTSLATGVCPSNVCPSNKIHPFRCCPSLPFGVRQLMSLESFSTLRLCQFGALLIPPITLEQAIDYCQKASPTIILYRIREGLTLQDLAQFYEFVLQKNYPELPYIDLVKYVESL